MRLPSRGVRPAGLLQFIPAWAQAHPDQGQRSPPRNLNLPFDDPNNYFGRYVYETVKHYAGRVDEWIVWNEPEFKPGDSGGGCFTWLGTDEEFVQLLKVAYLAARKANPNARVTFAGTSCWVDQNAHRRPFHERALAILSHDPAAAQNNWYHDAVAINLYRDPDDVLRISAMFQSIQRRFLGSQKPLWLTESNAMPNDDTHITCRHDDDPIQTTMEQQAAYAIQAFALAAAAGYERAGFYQMVDDNPCQQPSVWGAVRDDGSRRPVADALRTAITSFNKFLRARFTPLPRPGPHWSALPDDPDSYVPKWQLYQVVFDKPGNVRLSVLWSGDGGPTCVRLPRSGSAAYAIDKRGAPVVLQSSASAWQLTLPGASAHSADDPSRAVGRGWISCVEACGARGGG